MLVGCAMYVEILKAPSILSLTLQEDRVDTVQGHKHILKSASALQKLAKQDQKDWPTVKLVLTRVSEDGAQKAYQGGGGPSRTSLTTCSPNVLAKLWQTSRSWMGR